MSVRCSTFLRDHLFCSGDFPTRAVGPQLRLEGALSFVRQHQGVSCSPAIRKLMARFKSIQHCYARPMRLPMSMSLWPELTVCCLPS